MSVYIDQVIGDLRNATHYLQKINYKENEIRIKLHRIITEVGLTRNDYNDINSILLSTEEAEHGNKIEEYLSQHLIPRYLNQLVKVPKGIPIPWIIISYICQQVDLSEWNYLFSGLDICAGLDEHVQEIFFRLGQAEDGFAITIYSRQKEYTFFQDHNRTYEALLAYPWITLWNGVRPNSKLHITRHLYDHYGVQHYHVFERSEQVIAYQLFNVKRTWIANAILRDGILKDSNRLNFGVGLIHCLDENVRRTFKNISYGLIISPRDNISTLEKLTLQQVADAIQNNIAKIKMVDYSWTKIPITRKHYDFIRKNHDIITRSVILPEVDGGVQIAVKQTHLKVSELALGESFRHNEINFGLEYRENAGIPDVTNLWYDVLGASYTYYDDIPIVKGDPDVNLNMPLSVWYEDRKLNSDTYTNAYVHNLNLQLLNDQLYKTLIANGLNRENAAYVNIIVGQIYYEDNENVLTINPDRVLLRHVGEVYIVTKILITYIAGIMKGVGMGNLNIINGEEWVEKVYKALRFYISTNNYSINRFGIGERIDIRSIEGLLSSEMTYINVSNVTDQEMRAIVTIVGDNFVNGKIVIFQVQVAKYDVFIKETQKYELLNAIQPYVEFCGSTKLGNSSMFVTYCQDMKAVNLFDPKVTVSSPTKLFFGRTSMIPIHHIDEKVVIKGDKDLRPGDGFIMTTEWNDLKYTLGMATMLCRHVTTRRFVYQSEDYGIVQGSVDFARLKLFERIGTFCTYAKTNTIDLDGMGTAYLPNAKNTMSVEEVVSSACRLVLYWARKQGKSSNINVSLCDFGSGPFLNIMQTDHNYTMFDVNEYALDRIPEVDQYVGRIDINKALPLLEGSDGLAFNSIYFIPSWDKFRNSKQSLSDWFKTHFGVLEQRLKNGNVYIFNVPIISDSWAEKNGANFTCVKNENGRWMIQLGKYNYVEAWSEQDFLDFKSYISNSSLHLSMYVPSLSDYSNAVTLLGGHTTTKQVYLANVLYAAIPLLTIASG